MNILPSINESGSFRILRDSYFKENSGNDQITGTFSRNYLFYFILSNISHNNPIKNIYILFVVMMLDDKIGNYVYSEFKVSRDFKEGNSIMDPDGKSQFDKFFDIFMDLNMKLMNSLQITLTDLLQTNVIHQQKLNREGKITNLTIISIIRNYKNRLFIGQISESQLQQYRENNLIQKFLISMVDELRLHTEFVLNDKIGNKTLFHYDKYHHLNNVDDFYERQDKPCIIFLIGSPGSGKSNIRNMLIEKLFLDKSSKLYKSEYELKKGESKNDQYMRIIGERNVDDAVTSSRGYRGSIFNLINDSQKGLSGFPNRANIKASLNTLDEKKKISSIYKTKRDQEEDTKRNFKIGMDMTRNPNKHFLIEITGKNLTFLTKYMDTFKRNINDFNVIFVYVATGSINRFNMCKKRDDKEITKGVETYIDSVFNNKSFTPAPRVINYSEAVDCITEDKKVIENLKILRNICLKRDKPVADENRIYLDSERGKPEEKCGDKIFNDSNQFKLLIFRNNLEYSNEYMSNNESYELVYHHDYDKYLYTADFDRIIDKAYSDEILLHHVFGDDITGETAKSFIYTNVKFDFPKRIMDYYIPMTDYEYIIPVTTKKINPIYQNDTIDDIKTKPYRDRPIIKNPYAMSRLPKSDVYFPPTNPISVYYYNTIDFSGSSAYEKTFIETMSDSLRSFTTSPVKYQFSISKNNPLRTIRRNELVSTPSREYSSSSSSSSSSRPSIIILIIKTSIIILIIKTSIIILIIKTSIIILIIKTSIIIKTIFFVI